MVMLKTVELDHGGFDTVKLDETEKVWL